MSVTMKRFADNWGDMSDDEVPVQRAAGPPQQAKEPEVEFASGNLHGTAPVYMYAGPTVCQAGGQNLTDTEHQLFQKLRWGCDNVTIMQSMVASKQKPTLAISAGKRGVPTMENVAHVYYSLLVRIGGSYDAIRANCNYPEAPYKFNWYSVHVNRANRFYSDLVSCVNQYNGVDEQAATDRFASIKEEMGKPLPNLRFVPSYNTVIEPNLRPL